MKRKKESRAAVCLFTVSPTTAGLYGLFLMPGFSAAKLGFSAVIPRSSTFFASALPTSASSTSSAYALSASIPSILSASTLYVFALSTFSMFALLVSGPSGPFTFSL